ncbi:hypothetical protein B7494_g33 [Chlorociboria aeruginascens]|nr:hypothetical protein B7494_g33 [Chlorociboria aeruginascens]
MASTELVILSSSPPRLFTHHNMPSSPLPSPSQVFKKIPALCTGGAAASIPKTASATFTSASRLLKASSNGLESADEIGSIELDTERDVPKAAKKSTKPRAPRTTMKDGEEKPAKAPKKAGKDEAVADSAKVKKPRKSRPKKVDENGAPAAKEKAPRKSRAKNDAEAGGAQIKEKAVRKAKPKKVDETQMKIATGNVTKNTSTVGKVLTTATAESVSKHFGSRPTTPDPFVDSVGSGLNKAVKRRAEWTPPMATATTTTPGRIDSIGSATSITSEDKTKGFSGLFGSYGFTSDATSVLEKKFCDGMGVRKRKQIELVNANLPTTAPIIPKEKAPRKKARTITEQATSIYAVEEEIEFPPRPAPLLQYFSYKSSEGGTSNDTFKVPAKPRSKSPVKVALKRQSKGTAVEPILLSPESALKRTADQDFLFGTSSQLAREESPTLLRDIHVAMQASNEMDDKDPFLSPIPEAALPFLGREKKTSLAQRNLWAAASRDPGGKLMDIETVDMAGSPNGLLDLSNLATMSKQEAWLDVDNIGPFTQVGPDDNSEASFSGNTKTTSPAKAPKPPQLLKSPKRSSKKISAPKQQNFTEMPDFASFTTIRLAKEIASYHFKPVKNRDRMIALLEKCWEGKQRVALGTLATNQKMKSPVKSHITANQYSDETVSPEKSRDRSKEDSRPIPSPKRQVKSSVHGQAPTKSQKTVELLDEISDSDSLLTPSPPRRRPSQIKKLPQPLPLSQGTEESLLLSPTSQQTQLFAHITRAVTTVPPTKDPLQPTWHERILIYDPIILEDLAVWLNTGALEKAGWDGEVEPKTVKKWCESNSICCLWKENLRGGGRRQY